MIRNCGSRSRENKKQHGRYGFQFREKKKNIIFYCDKEKSKLVDLGKTKKDIALQFGVPLNTLSTWIKQRPAIVNG
jgi:transposase-like protein